MRNALFVILILLVGNTAQAAPAPYDKAYESSEKSYSAKSMTDACEVEIDINQNSTKIHKLPDYTMAGMCMGAIDMLGYMIGHNGQNCLPPTYSNKQGIHIFISWVNNNPSKWGYDYHIAMQEAFNEAFHCYLK